jgi:ubiquinone/menaquinone biosynthesis C-methylase UbiE
LKNKNYTYFTDNKDRELNVSQMKKYVKNKQEMDKVLIKLIKPYLKNKKIKVLDACCGIGHLDYFLSNLFLESSFQGIDQTSYLIDEARKLCSKRKNVTFEINDMSNISKKYSKFFDVTINWKTLSWLPHYDIMLKSLFDVTKNHIFISSLFYDEDIDFQIKVREFEKEKGKKGYNNYYNVYSYPRFEEFAYSLGAKKIKAYNFEIKKDLEKPKKNFMGTHTLNLENGKRVQVSGTIIMPWKIIRIDL